MIHTKLHASLPVSAFLAALVLAVLGGCISSPDDKKEPKEPAVQVDASVLDFGESADTRQFNVNVTGGTVDWEIAVEELPSWCVIDVERSTGGGCVTVNVDRSALSQGEHTATIVVQWPDGSHKVLIRAIGQAPAETGTIVIDTPLPE